MDSATPFQPWADEESVKNVKSEKELLLDDAKLRQENVIHPKHTQTASYNKESNANPIIPTESYCLNDPSDQPVRDRESKMDSNKIASMQHIVENTISQDGKQRVAQILEAVDALNGPERLLLYLRLPTGVPPHDPLKLPINPLGSRAELQQTVTWIQTHLEVDPDVSLPKQDVYDEYIAHCMSSNMKPLSTADFGKVMKQVYPTVRPRRLGTRGNSRYCYAGLRKKIKLEVPQLPDLGESAKELRATNREAERIVCDWAELKLGVKLSSVSELARHLSTSRGPPPPAPLSPPQQPHGSADDPASRQLMKQLKRKIQGQGTPGRPKKNKAVEGAGRSPPGGCGGAGAGAAWSGWTPAGVVGGEAPPRAHDAWRAPAEPAPLPMNLSSDASLDLRRRPPLPGKKLILETYRAASPPRAPPPPPPPAPLYLPKKMRAAETARADPPPPPAPPFPPTAPLHTPTLFLDDPKNLAIRSTSTAAALAREEHAATPSDPSDALDDVICGEKHVEILNRERVISICNIDKHDLDDYLHENSSQEHEEELLQYFQRREADGKSEKISQLRELLERNLRGGEPPAPTPASNGHAHGCGGGRYDFVPIACEPSLHASPASAASPFVSPRLTPCRRRAGPARPPGPLAPLAPHPPTPVPHLAPLHAPPLSADALSNEVSHFFAESLRSQSAPPKPPPLATLSYTSTPVGSVPPTPVPHEFCDFEACDISRAGLNPETLDKIYDAIDASADVLGVDALLPASRSVPCTPLPPGAGDAASKSVPATPHLPDAVFCYNRDFLINGHGGFPPDHPLHDMLDPAADLLAELDAPPIVYPDL